MLDLRECAYAFYIYIYLSSFNVVNKIVQMYTDYLISLWLFRLGPSVLTTVINTTEQEQIRKTFNKFHEILCDYVLAWVNYNLD